MANVNELAVVLMSNVTDPDGITDQMLFTLIYKDGTGRLVFPSERRMDFGKREGMTVQELVSTARTAMQNYAECVGQHAVITEHHIPEGFTDTEVLEWMRSLGMDLVIRETPEVEETVKALKANAANERTQEDRKLMRDLFDLMDKRIAARTNKQPELTDVGITLPAGDYYVGDPGYLLQDDTWFEILEACNFFKEPYVKDGQTAVAFGTWIGDGIYTDQEGREYPVDTGMIGVVPVAMAHPDESRCSWSEYPDTKRFHRITFPEPFLCKREDDGASLVFGDVDIDTVGFWADPAESAEEAAQ